MTPYEDIPMSANIRKNSTSRSETTVRLLEPGKPIPYLLLKITYFLLKIKRWIVPEHSSNTLPRAILIRAINFWYS